VIRAHRTETHRLALASAQAHERVLGWASNSHRDLFSALGLLSALLTVALVFGPVSLEVVSAGAWTALLVALVWALAVAATAAWCWTVWAPDLDARVAAARTRAAVWRARSGRLSDHRGLREAHRELLRATSCLPRAQRRVARREARHLAAEVDRFTAAAIDAGLVEVDPTGTAMLVDPLHPEVGAALAELVEHRRRRLVEMADTARVTAAGGASAAAQIAAQVEVDRCAGWCRSGPEAMVGGAVTAASPGSALPAAARSAASGTPAATARP
jgi:hypothetical protein